MNKAVSYLFFCLLLLTTGGFDLAHAEPLVDSRMSGSWYDPSHSGEGFLLDTNLVETGTAPADVVEDLQFLADQIRR
jgi:hypothetical protein